MLCSPPCGSGCSAAGRRQARFTGPRRGKRGARPSPTSCFHPSRRTARPGARGFSGRARTPAIPPAAGRGTHEGGYLVLTSCRPAYGDGCLRPPVPKAKLLLEQAGSEHRASARGRGGDSRVWKGASKGGNAPITGPFPPPGGHKGNVREKRRENGKMPVNPAKKNRETGKARRR